MDEKVLKFFTRRLFLFLTFKIFLFIILISRLFYLQILKHKHFLEKSQNNSTKRIFIPSKRGVIFDSNQKILAATLQVYVIYIKLDKISNLNLFFSKYEKIFDLTSEEKEFLIKSYDEFHSVNLFNKFKSSSEQLSGELSGKINKKKQNIIELKTISFEKVLIAKYNFEKLDDLYFIRKSLRIYPREELTAHIVGYLDNNFKKHKFLNFFENINFQNGVSGAEKKFNNELSGNPKVLELVVNAFGEKISEKIISNDSCDGGDINLSISSDLHELILNFFKERGDKKGSVVVSEFDEKTSLSKIIACVSAPSFNPNFFSDSSFKNSSEWKKINIDKDRPLINKAISGIYSPGSIFKVFIALAALEQGIITKNSKVFCDGSYFVGNRKYSCLGRHGSICVSDAIKFSCNTFFYALSKRMNIDELFEFGKLLGMGRISNLSLNGEKSGILPNESWKKKRFGDSWRIGDSANLMIGQGFVALTPLQFNSMISSIAFGVETKFSLLLNNIKEDLDVGSFNKINIASEENLKIIRDAMFRSVNEPGGTSFFSIGSRFPELRACGKTGTVQIFSKKDTGFNHSTFVGFMPFEKPKYSVSIVGEYCGYGSQFAGPLAGLIFKFLNDSRRS